MKHHRISLSTRLNILIISIILVISLGLMMTSYRSYSRKVEEFCYARTEEAAAIVSRSGGALMEDFRWLGLDWDERAQDQSARSAVYEEAIGKGLIELIGKEVDEAYYAATMSLLQQPKLLQEKGKNVTMVYTPLHGSGYVPVTTVLDRIGMKNVFPVPEQVKPDGNFPTVKAPNPEDPNAFTLAFKLAEEKKADVIIGTDPDSDRLGVAVRKNDGEWAVLTGNQIGSILLYCLLTAKKEAGLLPKNGLVVRSLVSTPLADAICASFGVDIVEVLTGFRFISEQIAECEAKHEHTFLFGFEESFGFLAGGFSRYKDAICAAMLVAEG